MENNRISILVGRKDSDALDLGNRLSHSGALVSYSQESPLHIQYEVLSKKPDALILSNMTRHADELCRLLKKTDKAPYIVVICDDADDEQNNCADLVLERSDNDRYEKLYSKLFSASRDLKRSDTAAVRFDKLIADALFELCITQNYNGYPFVLEAIKLASRSTTIAQCISKDIYPVIASKFGVTSCCVERNIRTVIRSSWARSSAAVKREYFGPFTLDDSWTPTNSQFIFIVADRLALRSGGHL